MLSRIDLVLCVDATGSMGPFISAAKKQLLGVLEGLQTKVGDELRVAIVAYREHSPQLPTTEAFSFGAPREAAKWLEALMPKSPTDNSDAAEAVFTGLVECLALPWRAGAYRIVVLAGDAPPHGCGAVGAAYADRYAVDPTGLSLDDMANRLEADGVFVHALAMVPTPYQAQLEKAFERLAVATGGSMHRVTGGDAAMAVVEQISRRFLDDLEFDARLFETMKGGEADSEALAKRLGVKAEQIWAGQMRLRQRRLIE
jgi:hypothetical protein